MSQPRTEESENYLSNSEETKTGDATKLTEGHLIRERKKGE
jgi:hypothetical protein